MLDFKIFKTPRRLTLMRCFPPTQQVETALNNALKLLMCATRHHFTHCLGQHDVEDGKYVIGNAYRQNINKPVDFPKPPKIPDRFEFSEATKAFCRQRVSAWHQYASVIRDKEIFEEFAPTPCIEPSESAKAAIENAPLTKTALKALALPLLPDILSYKQLNDIHDSFAAILRNGYQSPEQNQKDFDKLNLLIRHMSKVEPLGQKPHFRAYEYFMQFELYRTLRGQMLSIGDQLKRDQEKMPHDLFVAWFPVLQDGYLKIEPTVRKLGEWLQAQPRATKRAVDVLRKDPLAFHDVQERCYASQVRRDKGDRHSLMKCTGTAYSSSTASESSASLPNSFEDISLTEEPEPMQPQREGGRSEERPGERRERRDTSTESISARAPASKKVKGQRSGNA